MLVFEITASYLYLLSHRSANCDRDDHQGGMWRSANNRMVACYLLIGEHPSTPISISIFTCPRSFDIGDTGCSDGQEHFLMYYASKHENMK